MTGRMAEFHIGQRPVGPAYPAYIIAEVGINHGGDAAVCADMILAAARAGADAVKLQTVLADESYHPDTESHAVFANAVLTKDEMKVLMEHAAKAHIALFSTPGDFASLKLLKELGIPAIKISSGLLTNLPLISRSAEASVPLLLSTGMAHMTEIKSAVDAARVAGANDIAILQCTSLYPAPSRTLNLRTIGTLAREFDVVAGYSDHHDGILACVAAVAAGASIIEKHFSTTPDATGADHAISAGPDDFARMVQDIRDVEAMMGTDEKKPVDEELPLRDGRHRRLVAARDISAGETLGADDLYLMRLPGDREAISANRFNDAVGRKVRCDIARLSGVSAGMIEGLG